jgi:AcrR family transcriptional regulator
VSTAYEATGRVRQKARTRAALIEAARELLADGEAPTVEQTADRADISRTTAYRYFPNQRALLVATYPEVAAPSLLQQPAPADPVARLDSVTEHFCRQLLDHEPELRAQLRLSLEPGGEDREKLLLRQGRAIMWIEEALQPLRNVLAPDDLRKLVFAIRATVGIEPLVWLTDVAGMSRPEAVDIMRSSARTLVDGAIADTVSPQER